MTTLAALPTIDEASPPSPQVPAPSRRLTPLRRRITPLAGSLMCELLRRGISATRRRTSQSDGGARVTILLGSAWGMGGTIRTVLNLAGYLAQHHDVEILSMVRRRESPFFELPPGVRVTALDDQRRGATPIGLRTVARALRARRSVLMPRRTQPFPECSLWTDVHLARRLRRRTGVSSPRTSRSTCSPRTCNPRGWSRSGKSTCISARTERGSGGRWRGSIRVWTPSSSSPTGRSRDREIGEEPISPTVIPNSVRGLGGGRAPLTDPLILAAGRMTPQKGFDLLIHAFARVSDRHPDWRLRICGAGDQRRELLRLNEALGLSGVVDLDGPARNLGEAMQRASVFALSSRFEGMPLVLLEAMSKGLPVVSFDCPTGPRDVIEDHCNGILVPPGNVEAFSVGLRELVADDALRHRLGAEARNTAGRYSTRDIGERWESLIGALHDARIASAHSRR